MIRDCFHKFLIRVKVLFYNSFQKRLKSQIAKKQRIKIIFFVLYDNMWKSDGLFRLLLKSDRFDPCIVSTPYPHHPREFSQSNQNKLELFFRDKGFPYYNGYNFETDEWLSIKSLSPDIVFYQQPYNTGYQGFKIEALWKRCLFGYIPYTYELEKSSAMVNGLLMNIAWKVFLPSDYDVKRQSSILYNKGKNLVATGAPLADSLLSPIDGNTVALWKSQDYRFKRVIWAPHHSILSEDFLHYSNFLEISEQMLIIADNYKDRIQFAFKPHPVLKRKLYKLEGWGKEKTDLYYSRWSHGPNTTLVEGEYVELFKSSDAMMHDCSTFTAEYLYTRKPVLFVTKAGKTPDFNTFGKECLAMHYTGNTSGDIVSFLQEVVLNGEDPKKEEREFFYLTHLKPKNGKDTAHSIFDVFCEDFQIDKSI